MRRELYHNQNVPVQPGSYRGHNGMKPMQQQQVVGMAYVPPQVLGTMYEPEKAFVEGTLFPELNKPFLGGKCI